MYHNTKVYLSLIVFCLLVVWFVKTPYPVLVFFVTYILLFGVLEYGDLFPGWNIWSQQERTSECYDWFSHYLKKDYGIVNGTLEFDLSESIYFNDYTLSNEEALLNKYNLIFESLNLSKGKRMLDCGCGTGTWMSFCKERGVDVVGFTLSEEQQKTVEEKGLTAYVKDYRVFDKQFMNHFDAISVIGSTEHITVFSSFYTVEKNSYHAYANVFKILHQYLKPEGKILMTALVQGKPESERSDVYSRFQAYILSRHYGGYYSKVPIIHKAIIDNGFTIDSIQDYTRDYHWISVREPDHFGHWCVPWKENPLDKVGYFIKGLFTDPFLLHHWLYYGLDTWMWHLGGYQKTPLTDEQVKHAVGNLKYFSISKPKAHVTERRLNSAITEEPSSFYPS
jgi:cyclopropane fatty-acyl-phospholipid synthase-like methyltransferase